MTMRCMGAAARASFQPKFLIALAAAAFIGGCATTAPEQVKTPWASATSTNQWNDYANDLIARNAIGQLGALRTLAYTNLAIHNAIAQSGKETQSAGGAAAGAAATGRRRAAATSTSRTASPGRTMDL